MGGEPVGIAATGGAAGDIEDVLDGEGEAGERPAGRAVDMDPVVGAEGVGIEW